MVFLLNGEFLRMESREFENKEGKKTTYYTVAIVQGTDCQQFGASAEVAEHLKDAEKLQEFTFEFREGLKSGPSGPWINRYITGIID